jgi:hypothetical protein
MIIGLRPSFLGGDLSSLGYLGVSRIGLYMDEYGQNMSNDRVNLRHDIESRNLTEILWEAVLRYTKPYST